MRPRMDMASAGASAKKWVVRAIVWGLLLIVVGTVLYPFAALHMTYSNGERVGSVQKLSKRGWICKTDEGDLAMVNQPGQSAEMFAFTVRNDTVLKQIDDLSGHRVVLTYEEHRGIPSSCFGETSYFVTGVRKAD